MPCLEFPPLLLLRAEIRRSTQSLYYTRVSLFHRKGWVPYTQG
jgi:hypothetical protein